MITWLVRAVKLTHLSMFLVVGIANGVAMNFFIKAAREQAITEGYAKALISLPPETLTQLTVKDSM